MHRYQRKVTHVLEQSVLHTANKWIDGFDPRLVEGRALRCYIARLSMMVFSWIALTYDMHSCWAADSSFVTPSYVDNDTNDESVDLPSNPFALDKQLSCGPRCVQFLLSMHGQEVPYATILQECPPGPKGTSLKQVQECLEKHRLHTVAFSGATTSMLKRLQYPAIVHLRSKNEGGHFIVLVMWNENSKKFLALNPPNRYGGLTESYLARNLSGIGLVISESALPRAEELVPPTPSLMPWIAGAIVGLLCLFAGVSSWRSLVVSQ